LKLTGYKNLKKISESQLRVIYAGLREIDEMPVVLKSLRSMHPPTDVIALMIHEFEVTKGLNLRGIIKTYDLIEDHERYALVQEDMHGISLTEFLQQKPIADLPLFLQLAIEMTEILSELHQQNIIHKDIKPSNFIIHPKTLALKLTDFNFSSRLQREMQDIVPPNRLEGTLVYMAPEQTGRMNMNIDYRADFYALGVTFYEMLTGKIPFSFTDPLELLHAHLANPAPDVRNINPQIPEMLSKLVQKLMAKRPIKRYQSAIGIQADLIRCQEDLQEMNTIKPFTLGQADAYDRLNISQKLYGREEEAKTLLNTYKKVTQGAVSALMVCGYSGIGKTMLINEVHRPMVAD